MGRLGIIEGCDPLDNDLPSADQAAADQVSDRLGRQAEVHIGQF
jgi:hypothetical protein